MTSERDAAIRRLFAEASERPPGERSGWLSRNCPDPTLRQEVESLLSAEARRGSEVEGALAALPPLTDIADVLRNFTAAEDLSGRRIGRYEVLARLGRGGMGVVYQARDTRLGRLVALKLLPEALRADPRARERFLQEARAASALDHPAICTVHEINEEVEDRPFIVMAYVDGETVGEKIRRQPLPLAEAIEVAVEVAGALAAAHHLGIVHRDIKASNVMVTGAGRVQVLDFGLAKLPDVSLTSSGVTLGTVSSMSPEQVTGASVDQRTDIWALGVLLYEMITGQLPFKGERTETVLHAILHRDPPPITALRSGVPIQLDAIVAKALAKDPDRRYQHVDELPVDLRAIPVESPGLAPGGPTVAIRRSRARPLAIGLAGLSLTAIGVLIGSVLRSPATDAAPPVRFAVPLPAGHELSSWYQPLALSPDGSRLVYGASSGDDVRLYLRDFARVDAVALPGTDDARDPFFSPDGRWVAFFAGGKLKKVEVAGGIPQIVCDAAQISRGASWGPDDSIVFTLGVTSGLLRVPAGGGTPEALTVPNQASGEIGHLWPQHLPNGDVLFSVWSGDGWRTAVWRAGTGQWTVVLEGVAAARYVETGHLVFAQMLAGVAKPSLLAVRFDLADLAVRGAPVSVLEDPGLGGPNFAVARNGTLVYVAGGSPAWAGLDENSLVWWEPDGRTTPVGELQGYFEAPRLSPDGARVAVANFSPAGTYDVWVYELRRGTSTRISLTGSINNFPIWLPDGRRLTFNSSRTPPGLYRKSADGGGEADQVVPRNRQPQVPGGWSPDGQTLVYTELDAAGHGDLWTYRVGVGVAPLLATGANETSPAFSPDGRHLAYVSDASGREEVYLRNFPGLGGTVLLSVDGGREPVWSPDGRALFFRAGRAMMAVDFGPKPGLEVGRPRRLFEGRFVPSTFDHANYDVSADGRFLMVQASPASTPTQLNVVLGWLGTLEERVPGER